MRLGDYRTWLERITLVGGCVRACCSSAGKGNWSIALHRGRGSCTRSSGPLYTIVVRSYKVSEVARSVHAVVPGNRAAITLATTRFLHTCTMIPLKICSSQAVEKGQISGGVDSQFVLTWHVLCETERPRLSADLAQPRGPDGEVHSSSSHAHGNGAQARAKGTARMGGPPEGGGPPRAAIQRGPCPKVPAEFDRRPTRRRSWAPLPAARSTRTKVKR